ncbi:MAG: 30S ribosomal protein S9 [bacterium]|nr:30S ribosomal protein S9 [bacterium]
MATKSSVKPKKEEAVIVPQGKYIEAIGRRKTAIARVRVSFQGQGAFIVNEKPLEQYFQDPFFQNVAKDALQRTGVAAGVSVRVQGGGVPSQAEAIRLGISRALCEENGELRPQLKGLGYLTRDPRMRERKKFGLKRARRGPQWKKR